MRGKNELQPMQYYMGSQPAMDSGIQAGLNTSSVHWSLSPVRVLGIM